MSTGFLRYLLIGAFAALLLGTLSPAFAAGPQTSVHQDSRYMQDFPRELLDVQPPWNAPIYDGTEVTVPGLENVPDIHGDINDPQLVIYFAGNQYMVVTRLMNEFMKANPEYRHVVAFTFPPGRLITSLERGQGILLGNMRITLKPDILAAGQGSMKTLQDQHHWFERTEVYARNRLAIMVYKGNPKHVTGLKSLAEPALRLCMPNPEWEGIAKHAIMPALKEAGGEALVNTVYHDKVTNGTTFLTHIHHRETPIRIMEKRCDAGVVWYTEAYFHDRMMHHPISTVTIPDRDNKVVGYTAGQMKDAPHPAAAKAFMSFLMSPAGQAIYTNYRFLPPGK
ncbi:MAG TPA: substrate-binding domain-containing protein [Gammaproteobacteria bacterium]|nr:substrate-binding domain-containing protein [Gammaproteobacteria bacterium]